MLPPFLNSNDQIRIISPSGVIDPTFLDAAAHRLSSWGLVVSEGKFAREKYGRFAGTKMQRLADLQDAFDDLDVKAILCSRGGYGIAQIIDQVDFATFCEHPKWLIGFSDITILHQAITHHGFASLHGIMTKHIAELPENAEALIDLREILFGNLPVYKIIHSPENRIGSSTGKLIGGNLSVFVAMRSTAIDLAFKHNILFIEDVSEKPYHIDRLIQNLRLSGALAQLSGLIVGQFSDCDEDPLMKQTITEIISEAVAGYDYPVCFNFPAGHIDDNRPLIMGQNLNLHVNKNEVEIYY
jgi:muramoyltetrapeptide carboxypeptidase